MMRKYKLDIVVFITFLFLPLILYGQKNTNKGGWKQFWGNNYSGLADENITPPVELNGSILQWKMPNPVRHSSPCTAGNEISSYSVAEGKRLWWFPYLSTGINIPGTGDNLIYIRTTNYLYSSAYPKNRQTITLTNKY